MTGVPLRRSTQQDSSAVASKEAPLTPSYPGPVLLEGHAHRDPVGNLLARLAATLLGVMYFSWVVILHAPRIAHALRNRDEWNSGFVCLIMAGCALIAAALAPHMQSREPR